MTAGSSAPALLPACKHCGKFHPPGTLKCPHTDMALDLEGRLLDGRFRFIERLGSGGMAEVWLAHNEMVDRRVAIKLLRPEVTRNEEAVERFKIEARAAGRIGSPHVCEIMDFGSSSIGPYIVMEWLKGRDLAQWIESEGSLEVDDAVWVVRQALRGLIDAHAAGVLHRDLKPGNVFIHELENGDSIVKLMDFGVSKLLDDRGRELTSAGMMLGTPEYMAPEQLMAAGDIDERADVWAIGAILYRALSGERVFSGPNLAAVCHSVANESIVPLDERTQDLPASLVEIIHRCLDRNIDGRYATAKELSIALEPFDRIALQTPLRLVDQASGTISVHTRELKSSGGSRGSKSFAGTKRFIRDLSLACLGLSAIGAVYYFVVINNSESGSSNIESTVKHLLADSPFSIREGVKGIEFGSTPTQSNRPNAEQSTISPPPMLPLPPPPPLDRVGDAGVEGSGSSAKSVNSAAFDEPNQHQAPGVSGLSGEEGGDSNSLAGTTTGLASMVEQEPQRSDADAANRSVVEDKNSLDASRSSGTAKTGSPSQKKERKRSFDSNKSSTDSEKSPKAKGLVTDTKSSPDSPPGTVEVDGLLGLLDRAPSMGQQEAKRYCLGLGEAGHLGIRKWRLPRPDEFQRFVGNSLIRRGRYWSSAMWRGRSRVITLPSGREQSVKITRRLIRPFCVAPR